jgi:hypothetical protein
MNVPGSGHDRGKHGGQGLTPAFLGDKRPELIALESRIVINGLSVDIRKAHCMEAKWKSQERDDEENHFSNTILAYRIKKIDYAFHRSLPEIFELTIRQAMYQNNEIQ